MALSIVNNVASLTAQGNLARTSNALSQSLERLSSGLKINRGADGPAGLVISEEQRAQITGLQTAITNTSKAVNLVQTGEGALNEINALLDKVRGLALDSANAGVNDSNALAANQAEITNSLATIDRIANTTQFGTKKLLDGSAAAQVTIGTTGATNLSSATAGASTLAGTYNVSITQQGQKAQVLGANAFAAATNAATTTNGGTAAISGSATISSTLTQVGTYNVAITQQGVKGNITGASNGTATAAAGGTVIVSANGITSGAYTITAGDTAATTATGIQGVVDAAFGAGTYTVAQNAGTHQFSITATKFAAESTPLTVATTGGASAATGFTNGQAGTQGAALQVQISGGNLSSPISVTGTVNGDTINVTAGISSIAQGLNFVVNSSGTTTAAVGASATVAVTGTSSLTVGSGASATTLNLNAQNSDTLAHLVSALNVNSATTGVTASANLANTNLVLTANKFGGSDFAFSATGASSGVTTNQAYAQHAQDLQAKVFDATGTQLGGLITGAGPGGNVITAANSATQNFGAANGLSFTFAAASGTLNNVAGTQSPSVPSAGQYTSSVSIADALIFQVGANASQTAAVSINQATSDHLGLNVAGLANPNTSSLSKIDVTTTNGAQDAISVVDKAINDISSLRGKLGAFQANSLQGTASNLQTILQNTTAAESTIRDTDFAAETANFTRNQVLLQAGTQVLVNSNQQSQLVLALLKG